MKKYQIPFLSQPLTEHSYQVKLVKPVVTEEIGNLLKKVAIEKFQLKRFLKKSVFVQSISSK